MKTIEVLKKLDRNTKAEVYIVGGTVRDMFRRKQNDDLDIVIRKLDIKRIVRFLKKHGSVKFVELSKTNDVFSVSVLLFKSHDDENAAQISIAKRGKEQITSPGNTLKQDSAHRDFTINAMYLPINETSRNAIIDYHNGKESIKNRRIVAVGNADERLVESPIRILRAVSLSARIKYRLDKTLIEAIKKNVHLLHKVPYNCIRVEINKILLSQKPSTSFNLMRYLGILHVIFPELYKCIGVKQDERYHKYDVYKHCIYTCDHIKPKLFLRLAAVLHDIGKVDTRKIIKGKVTFHKHEMASVKLAKVFLNRLRYSNDIRKEVLSLVRNHMYHYTRNFSDIAIRRFIIRTGINEENVKHLDDFPLFQLRAAERLGNGLKTIPVTERQTDFQNRIVETFNSSSGLKIGDLDIDGAILMSVFRIDPGPVVGRVLSYLLDSVIEKPNLNDRTSLIKKASEYIMNEKIIEV